MNRCPVCTWTPCEARGGMIPDTTEYRCPRCGEYLLTGTAAAVLDGKISSGQVDRTALSHHIFKMQPIESGRKVLLRDTDLDSLGDRTQRPTPEEQFETLVLWIGSQQPAPDVYARVRREQLAARLGTAVTPNNVSEPALDWLIRETLTRRDYEMGGDVEGKFAMRLTIKGWALYHDLSRKMSTSRRAFMAMKFGEPLLLKVLNECFKPATAAAGFELRPLNEGQPAGLIDNQIRAAIRSARFVVADLTHDNDGAYFEAGFAEGLGLQVIYTCEKTKFDAKKTHFDTNHMVTIPWCEGALAEAANQLTATIRATFPGDAVFG